MLVCSMSCADHSHSERQSQGLTLALISILLPAKGELAAGTIPLHLLRQPLGRLCAQLSQLHRMDSTSVNISMYLPQLCSFHLPTFGAQALGICTVTISKWDSGAAGIGAMCLQSRKCWHTNT